MRTYKTEGIILKRVNFGEADRLLTIFTKHYGKIKARAPGIRRTTSRKAPHLELFNLSSLFLAQGKNFDIVTEAVTLANFSGIRKDLKKVGMAYYICELVDGLCPERQENREVFELLKGSLESLSGFMKHVILGKRQLALTPESEGDSGQARMTILGETFANQLLQTLGFLPRNKSLIGGNLEHFIENILERKLKSGQLLRKTGG